MAAQEIRWLGPGDEALLVAASHLFDAPVAAEGAARFLARAGHHLAIAYVDDVPAGFVSGMELDHPDKGPEVLLYELGVEDAFRRRGLGAALVLALEGRARDLGCRGTWVLTEPDNDAALATYRRAGSSAPEPVVVLEWSPPT